MKVKVPNKKVKRNTINLKNILVINKKRNEM